MTVLVTGAAGFIGYHLSNKLLEKGHEVIGFDNLNNYYDINLKKNRLNNLQDLSKRNNYSFKFVKNNLENHKELKKVFSSSNINFVFNLAAQAGVRYSITNPFAYIKSNIDGFINILECCRSYEVKHLLYASSSSVYGGNKNMPFNEEQGVDHPISIYAATKRSNELMAHTYSHLYNIPSTGLRFFTVYGPWGRPDMALFLFTKSILENEPIKIFNNGNMIRDFTYVDDIVTSMMKILEKIPSDNHSFDYLNPKPNLSWAPHRIFNIGNSNPTKLLDYISAIEDSLGIQAKKEFHPIQPGDVEATSADTNSLENLINFKPNTSIQEGVSKFVDWYRKYYEV